MHFKVSSSYLYRPSKLMHPYLEINYKSYVVNGIHVFESKTHYVYDVNRQDT